jgi:putative ABC transport system permease protein
MLTTFTRDLRLGARQLVRQPAFAAAAVLSLALGIGLNTTLFSIVNAVLLRGGPIAEPDRLVEIYTGPNRDYPQLTTSYPDLLDIREGVPSLAAVSGSAYVRGILATGGQPSLVTGEAVTTNYFDLLGIRPALGRWFREDEGRAAGAVPVATLSHGLWQRRFGARSNVVGETFELSGLVYTVIGVAPREFTGTLPGIPTEVWVPVTMIDRLVFSGVQFSMGTEANVASRLDRRGTRWLFVKGRLAEGRTLEQARAEVETVFARLRSAYPDTNEEALISVEPAAGIRFHPMLDGYIRGASAALLGAVGLVLLIACGNVANLMLARGSARRREFAVRAAVGASRARIVSQLLTEGLVLAAAGGTLGVLIAWWAGRMLSGMGTDVFPVPVSFEFSIDTTVLLFALAATVATAVLFGLAPAWTSSRPELVPALKESAEGSARRRVGLRDVLVVGQLALSLVLLVAGALLLRGLVAARSTDLGFDPAPVSSLSFNLQMNGYDVERATAFRDRAMETLRALPGVEAVSTASRLPLAPDINADGMLVPGHHAPDDQGTIVDVVEVGADYFTAVGVPIVEGRAFTDADIEERRRVAIVNQTLARQFWPGQSAVGRSFHSGGFDTDPFEIVGVARDHKVRSVGEADRAYLHRPASPSRNIGLVVRTNLPAEIALPSLRQALWSLEPDIVFTEDVPAAQVADATMAPTRLAAMALGAFGALALLLASVGLYSVIAYSVSRRTREVGIRIALGAARGQVLRLVLLQGVRLALVGIGIGVVASLGVGRLIESLLYGVSGVDPLAYAAAAGVLGLVALAANLVPALSAARVDPVRALRTE